MPTPLRAYNPVAQRVETAGRQAAPAAVRQIPAIRGSPPTGMTMAQDDSATQAALAAQALRAAADLPPRDAALALAELVNRSSVELHKLARAQAQAQRGETDWGAWAKLANAARTAVLQAASCRDAARGLTRRE